MTDDIRVLLSPLSNGKDWRVASPIHYTTDAGILIEVPVGFITDFASVPRIVRPWISEWGKHGIGSIIHDYLYTSKEMSRYDADTVFREIMNKHEVSYVKINLIYLAIRLFGGSRWIK